MRIQEGSAVTDKRDCLAMRLQEVKCFRKFQRGLQNKNKEVKRKYFKKKRKEYCEC